MNINKKKYIIMGIGCLLILVCGITYAYLINNNSGKINNFIALDNIDIEYIDGESINSSDFQIPMKDSEVLEYAPSYSFTVKNNYKDKVYLKFKLTNLNIDSTNKEVYDDGNLRYMLYNGDEKIASGTIANYNEQTKEVTLLTNYEQESNISKTYKLYVYIKDTWQNQNHFLNKNITGKIRVEGYDKKLPTLASKIIENNPIDINTPDFSKVVTTDEGLIRGEDSDGYTYYFRGDVKDNYVKIGNLKYGTTQHYWILGVNKADFPESFNSEEKAIDACNTDFSKYKYISADECINSIYKVDGHDADDDMLWRIVRVNGDGTIRLIANGSIGNTKYNTNSKSEEYSGFTYKEHVRFKDVGMLDKSFTYNYDLNNKYTYASSYTFDTSTGDYILNNSEEHTLQECIDNQSLCINKYMIKGLKDKDYTIYYVTNVGSVVGEGENKASITYYAFKGRGETIFDEMSEEKESDIKLFLDNWYDNNLSKYDNILANTRFCNDSSITSISTAEGGTYYSSNRLRYIYKPIFTCPDTEQVYGGEYNLKIGLLTADEATFAGAKWFNHNPNYYLFGIAPHFSLFSPSFYHSDSMVWYIGNAGFTHYYLYVRENADVVPVINIKADVLYEIGDGTIDNPYQIQNI